MTEAPPKTDSNPAKSFVIARHFFLRLMGGIYFVAFLSIAFQAQGLWGSVGILPVKELLDVARDFYAGQHLWQHPTIFWINCSDSFIQFICICGMGLGLLLMLGILPALVSLLLWFLYLSFIYIGQDFFTYQWDILLVEVGFLCIFLSPWRRTLTSGKEPVPRLMLLLIYVLLFKVMMQSGLVKLLSRDVAWSDLTALTYHYWTQPIPNPASWYVHQLPLGLQKFSCLMMFIIELCVPCWIFLGRWMRRAAILPLMGLQILIFCTGNYGFFNLLVIGLCVLLIDDEMFGWMLPKNLKDKLNPPFTEIVGQEWSSCVKNGTCLGVAIVITLMNIGLGIRMSYGPKALPGPLLGLTKKLSPLLLTNSYGLFAVMTKTRPEIVIEGSHDGVTWAAYEFRYKPGRLDRRPPQVAPYQPRIDWQMWFAGLDGRLESSPWFIRMLERMADGNATVLKLLDGNPFPGRPPKYFRAKLYHYEFTTPEERQKSGHWWKRTYQRMYAPQMYLRRPTNNDP